MKRLTTIIMAIALSSCAAKQAAVQNGGTTEPATSETAARAFLEIPFRDGNGQSAQAAQNIATLALSQKPVVIMQLASVACAPCKVEAKEIRDYIKAQNLSDQVEHILGFVDVQDPNNIERELVQANLDDFIEKAGSENLKYIAGTYSSGTFYTYIFSQNSTNLVPHGDHAKDDVIRFVQSALNGN